MRKVLLPWMLRTLDLQSHAAGYVVFGIVNIYVQMLFVKNLEKTIVL